MKFDSQRRRLIFFVLQGVALFRLFGSAGAESWQNEEKSTALVPWYLAKRLNGRIRVSRPNQLRKDLILGFDEAQALKAQRPPDGIHWLVETKINANPADLRDLGVSFAASGNYRQKRDYILKRGHEIPEAKAVLHALEREQVNYALGFTSSELYVAENVSEFPGSDQPWGGLAPERSISAITWKGAPIPIWIALVDENIPARESLGAVIHELVHVNSSYLAAERSRRGKPQPERGVLSAAQAEHVQAIVDRLPPRVVNGLRKWGEEEGFGLEEPDWVETIDYLAEELRAQYAEEWVTHAEIGRPRIRGLLDATSAGQALQAIDDHNLRRASLAIMDEGFGSYAGTVAPGHEGTIYAILDQVVPLVSVADPKRTEFWLAE